jgi:hypothetical protein
MFIQQTPARGQPRPHPPAASWLPPWQVTAALAWGSCAAFAGLWSSRSTRAAWSADASAIAERCLRSAAFLDLLALNNQTLATLARLTSSSRVR